MFVENFYKYDKCSCRIVHESDYEIVVHGVILDDIKDNIIEYVAASPPDFRATFTGSGLPFANERMAFEGTPNSGVMQLPLGSKFTIKILYPNSYYVGLGTVIIPPTLYITYWTRDGNRKFVPIPVSKGIPFRFLTYPMQFTKARKDATFYEGGWQLPVRTQEQILRSSAYPSVNSMPENFWGDKPRQ